MRKLLLTGILSFVCFSFSLIAQTEGISETEVIYPDKFMVTQPLRTMVPAVIDEGDANRPKPEMKDRALRVPFSEKTNPDAEPKGEDPAAQKTMGFKSTITPLVNFAGQNGNGTPPDPTGAAGPDHFVQAVNSYYKVYTKAGGNAAGPLHSVRFCLTATMETPLSCMINLLSAGLLPNSITPARIMSILLFPPAMTRQAATIHISLHQLFCLIT